MNKPVSHENAIASIIVVNAPIERAFAVFTEGFGSWFPPEYNLLSTPLASRIFEPRVGGRVYDRGVDGCECTWAHVLAYDPPTRVVLSWDISPAWQIESDLLNTSEVEVRFIAESQERTRVELEHRNFDRHGEGWRQMRDQLDSEGGWPGCLRRFAEKSAA